MHTSSASSVSSAFAVDAFGRRHIGTTPRDHEWMLAALGYDSLDTLMTAAVPRRFAWQT